jgi:hypothetical protein
MPNRLASRVTLNGEVLLRLFQCGAERRARLVVAMPPQITIGAVYCNRSRLKSGVGKQAMRKRGEMVERSFAHVLDRGGMRRAWLRGRQNVHKRYLIHVAGFNLGILMRAMFGQGTPREAASATSAIMFYVQSDYTQAIAIISVIGGETAMLVIIVAPDAV